MRLTLRTLLAYMDGLLEPKDSQEIGKKIEDSKYATDLFHKIRDVMRRLRLAAPSITERGANLDCNTVAEYLDNALPSDRVPDFEEVSLRSEMHLAEVASCHQILTMVLGEPAEIDPESRQRMYQLPTVASRVDEERLAAAEAANALSSDGNAAAPPAPPAKSRPRPVVPEYLRDPPKKSRLLPAAAMTFLASAAITLILMMLHQFDAGTPLGNGLQWLQARLPGRSIRDEGPDEGDVKTVSKPSGGETAKPSGSGASGSAATGASSEAVSKSTAAASVPSANEAISPPAAKDSGTPATTPGKNEVPPTIAEKPLGDSVPNKTPGVTIASSPAPGVPSSPPGTADSPAGVATAEMNSETKPGVPGKSTVPSVARPDVKSAEPKPLPGGSTVAAPLTKPPVEVAKIDSPMPAGPQLKPGITPPIIGPGSPSPSPSAEDKTKIGRFMSDGQDVLLKFEANNTGWRRVLPEEFLAGHQPLLALPSYRPRLVILNVGATLELINGTRIELLPEDAQGQPGVDIDFGRMVIKPLAQAGARLRVVVGSHAGTITLTNVESTAGLEVTRVHDTGTDPEKVLSHALTKLYVARGGAVWEEGGGKQPVRLTAPAALMLDGAEADTPGDGKDVPKWITANTVNELDQRAALSVSQALPADRAASLGLNELMEAHRWQKEIRWLAARCLGYLGQFNPMTAALNDADFRREWPDYVDQLKEAIARGPETAAAIRQSLEQQYGNESAVLYRMLWGYTDKNLEDGEDARLVKLLDHEALVFRVLAFGNLKEITNRTHSYRPDSSPAKRLPAVQLWRRDQQLGKIRYKVLEAAPPVGPAKTPAKQPAAEPPKPPDAEDPADVKPLSATEPIAPGPEVRRASLPVDSPGSETSERPPRIVFPEPESANGK